MVNLNFSKCFSISILIMEKRINTSEFCRNFLGYQDVEFRLFFNQIMEYYSDSDDFVDENVYF